MIAAGKLPWRRALIATVAVTVLLTLYGGGRDWPMYLLVLPLTLLIGGATFGALWLARTVFYCVIGVLAYVAGLLVVDHFVAVNFVHWLVWPFGCALVLALYMGLFSLSTNPGRTARASSSCGCWRWWRCMWQSGCCWGTVIKAGSSPYPPLRWWRL